MAARDLQKNNEVNTAATTGFGRGCSTLILAVVVALTFVRSVNAQTQATPQAPTQTQAPAQTPAKTANEPTEKTEGNYAVQQSIEFGYRDSMIGGNLNNYDTFENLSSGVRLFDYSLDMRSINHQGLFFDNLSFSNFGYGGDPNDVSRLHVDKNKWYDFRGMVRRDKNFWNYNLLANPLNPVSSIPGAAITSSPHALDLSHRMQDYDLTLFPQSRLRFRLGYSRNVNTGPAYTTLEGGTEPLLSENVNDITNSYRMGVDYRGLSKTTLSFDEMLTYTDVNNRVTDNNLLFRLSNGTPVDLGIVFVGTSPCANPITNSATTPPTVTANCNGYLSYSQFQNPRSSFPTERVSFQSTYFRNLSMSGSAAYSSGNNTVTDFNDLINGWVTRTLHAREHDRRPHAGQPGLRQRKLVRRVSSDRQDEYRRPVFLQQLEDPVHVGHGRHQPFRHAAPSSRSNWFPPACGDGHACQLCRHLLDGPLQWSQLPAAQLEFWRRCDE